MSLKLLVNLTLKLENFFFYISAVGEKPPKVIITGRSYDSVTLSFDHFAPEEYHHGYVALVRLIFSRKMILNRVNNLNTALARLIFSRKIIPNIVNNIYVALVKLILSHRIELKIKWKQLNVITVNTNSVN
jgi:hypothetical protein